MEIKRALMIALAIALAVGLQSALASADPLDQAVADDGSQLVTLESTTQVMKPYRGTGLRTAESLAAQGVILEQPNLEAEKGLKPLAGGAGIESIIGWDTRVQTYTTTFPARATVLITNTTNGFFCSGFMIGSNTVATAGHCVNRGGGAGWYTLAGYRVYPGRNHDSTPYGYCTAKRLYSVSGWTVSGLEEYDYGAIKLNCTVGLTVGTFGFYWTSASLTNHPSIVPGYPGDKTGTLQNTQWWGSDVIRYTTAQQLFYNNDTYGGMSGSPVWEDKIGSPLPDSDGPYAMAIHGYGVHGTPPHSYYNHGKRITSAAYTNLVNWKNAP